MTQTITVIRGDGIGPEIMDATLSVLNALQANPELRIRRCRLERT